MKKKIAVFTSTRADFGLLKPLIQRLIEANKLDVRLFVTGTHLDQDFGSTVSEIEKEFPNHIFYRVPQPMKEDPKFQNLKIMSQMISKFAEAIINQPVDYAIVLGDRYESFCFGIVCSSLGIPIIHLHGGELTLGAIDDKFRHCLTKLSNWHFVACESYARRVIQMGEAPATVFNVGALGVDNALHQKLMSIEELQQSLGFPFQNFGEIYLFTFHPETNSKDYGAAVLEAFLTQLGARLKKQKALVVMTGVNSDPGSQKIIQQLQKFKFENAPFVFSKESLGLTRYLSVMSMATAVVGNSSSGILEAFSMKTPTINLGSRQEGRVRESSVIDLKNESDCAQFSFEKVVELKAKLKAGKAEKSVFGDGQTSVLMARQIELIAEEKTISMIKNFFDLPK